MTSPVHSIPRPGLSLGSYPERCVHRTNVLDAVYSRFTARAKALWDLRARGRDQVVASIDQAGVPLVSMSDEDIAEHISVLRERMVYTGWNDDLAICAFALVREMSGRVLGMRHFDSQLLGGWAMYQGRLAEMQTGEGKTLAAVLPAVAAALAGIPVHVITANDYLATRDARQMRPLFETFGLSVGVVAQGMDFNDRRAAYCCDITYTTGKQVCFDYLRDRLERRSRVTKLNFELNRAVCEPSEGGDFMLRGLCFAIVDEADSVLIDEACTPLVLSRAVEADDSMNVMYKQALALADNLIVDTDYLLLERKRQVVLTPSGVERLSSLTLQMGADWKLSRQRDELVQQALVAKTIFLLDRDYVVRENKLQIVDSNTGRIMADHTWEKGLHQMVELKEGCAPSGHNETLARISYQRFFGRYLKLAGISGTACEVKGELEKVYGLTVARIPPYRNCRRIVMPELIFLDVLDAHATVVASALEVSALGRPVLIGTKSVQTSELIAQRLMSAGSRVQVLNARQDEEESKVIAQAGLAGQITVATNMAGRGTDIKLGQGVEEKGGLHVIITERNNAGRIDRQLRGRCARQGDAGSCQSITTLDDEIPSRCYGKFARFFLTRFACGLPRQLPGWLGSRVLDISQRRCERGFERARRRVEREDNRLETILSFSGEQE